MKSYLLLLVTAIKRTAPRDGKHRDEFHAKLLMHLPRRADETSLQLPCVLESVKIAADFNVSWN
jgi:hypothetical protein